MRFELFFATIAVLGAAMVEADFSWAGQGDLLDLSDAGLQGELERMFGSGAYPDLEKAFAREEIYARVKDWALYRRIIVAAMQATDEGLQRRYTGLFGRDIWEAEYEKGPVKRLLQKMVASPGSARRWTGILRMVLENEGIANKIEREKAYDQQLVALVKSPELADAFYERYIPTHFYKLIVMIRRNINRTKRMDIRASLIPVPRLWLREFNILY